MRALSIAWKDFRHTYRDPAALAMMLVAPMLLAAALGAAFGTGDNFSLRPVRTVVVDQDVGASGQDAVEFRVGRHLVSVLSGPELADIIALSGTGTAEEARRAVDNDEAEVAVIIPTGLSEGLRGGAGAPGVEEVELYRNPAANVGPAIVASIVESVIIQLEGARASAAASVQLAAESGVTDGDRLAALAARTAEAYLTEARQGAQVQLEARAPTPPGGEAREVTNVAGQVLIGMMIFFMLFGAATAARSILDEHRRGTLFRLFLTPTPRWVILGGKYVAVFAVVLLQSVILLVAGWLLLRARWGPIGPVAILTLAGAVVAASLGLLTVSFARTPAQAGAVSSAIFVFLALIGGNFVGTASIGGAFAVARRFTPNGWLLEGWGGVMYGGSWESIGLPVLAALAFALVFLALSAWFFRRRYA